MGHRAGEHAPHCPKARAFSRPWRRCSGWLSSAHSTRTDGTAFSQSPCEQMKRSRRQRRLADEGRTVDDAESAPDLKGWKG